MWNKRSWGRLLGSSHFSEHILVEVKLSVQPHILQIQQMVLKCQEVALKHVYFLASSGAMLLYERVILKQQCTQKHSEEAETVTWSQR